MALIHQEDGVTVHHGEALATLREMDAESVHCCVTSPPYWGLRDYGTAEWVGGDVDCDHRNHHGEQGQTGQRAGRTFTGAQNYYRDECLKCGARRVDQQLGLEKTPEEYVGRLVAIFGEVRRVLRDDGTLWLNLGDSYAASRSYQVADNKNPAVGPTRNSARSAPPDNLKQKDLIGIPWRVAFALQADGWYLRSDIIWSKPNPMPESVTDRPTKSHEYLFLLAKSERYYYDHEAIAERSVSEHGSGNGFKRESRLSFLDADGTTPRGNDKPWKPNGKHSRTDPQAPGRRMVENVARARANGADHDSPFGGTRNRRSVWTINTEAYPEAHFATFPPDLVRPCILAGCVKGGVVLDPFAGSGTTLEVAKSLHCGAVGIELNGEYCQLILNRLRQSVMEFE